ncbi:uncharacterized protein BXZ73DRAFT_99338 [Epithele typhae]|uniref:uncharacterized protein n=1 Tax=Epithele typhae TaxID=378194 RepID=UPI0020087469|nr:uncharacterized protein BXZ73DRAFT_99338 [Epithele typhae]KAH9939703.1 hypothetical protein BXZ73DRAFT_99338 [Epithele typhae]
MIQVSAAFFSLAVAVASSYAFVTPRSDAVACPNARPVKASAVAVGDRTVELTTFACDAAGSSLTARTTNDVCGVNCTNVCAVVGDLPPDQSDCSVIFDAITILNGSVAPEFSVDAGHMQTLSFGTCRIFFQNFSPQPLEYCWLSFGQVASAAGSACFPPVQPVNSEGLCIASDGTWRVGIAHS